MNPDPTAAEPLPHARSLAALGSAFVLALSALCWGHRGLVSAAAGSLLSFANVWALERFAQRAVERAAIGDASVAAPLTAALSAKTVVLLTTSWVLLRAGRLLPLPFGLGYLVSIFSLLGAGLFAARREA
ncbi:MAG TPA: hypothetical protein VH853_14225 [Polyangia bacterium]|jgi:hypothetical protein|nr:hypothetical protein [Polyangia bacterium]